MVLVLVVTSLLLVNNVAISTVTGAIIVENGGVGIAKSLHVGEGGYFAGIVSATSYYGDGTNLTGVEMLVVQ